MVETGEAMETGSGEGLVRAVQSMYKECDARVKVGKKIQSGLKWIRVRGRFVVSRRGCLICSWTP